MGKGYREDRREFLRTLGRGIALGGLLIGTGWLVTKGDSPIETCTSNGICRACGDLNACNLPSALSYKQSKKES